MYFIAIFTYNPFGIKQNRFLFSYKHIFSSGMWMTFNVRYKANNSELLNCITDLNP